MSIPEASLKNIHDRETLYAFLQETLGWPVDPEDTFTYTGPQLQASTATRAEVGQFIPFSAGDPFALMLVEFQTELRRGDLREILRAIRADDRTLGKYGNKRPEEIIFVCAEKEYAGIRFAHFEEREGRQPKLRVFGWERDQVGETRTLRDFNLSQLRMPSRNVLDEPDWDEGRERWLMAWDVEKVTKEFYRDYEQVFHQVEERITGVRGDKRLFTQRLFNRLLFVHFLSKKKWLRFNGRTDYLNALWEGRDRDANFYEAHLSPLFFAGLNNPQAQNLMKNNPVLHAHIGDVKYLNGGLFEPAEDDRKGEKIDDDAFPLIFEQLFNRYNFTITESTPDDIDVAVDPEMLGKVFEELVTGRHETGSYYTPRPVVTFMCREALKKYLGGYDALVDQHDASAISVPEARQLLGRLAAIKVVDPACGSGAYLLGMLHELHALTRLLDTRAEEATARDDYQRKLHIIQHNLYGVDLDPFAINTARLRLWLSLAVEFNGDIPEPLPNLDFKVEQGDSLLAPDPRKADASCPGELSFRGNGIRKYDEAKTKYADPYYRGNKADLKHEIAALRQEIAEWTHPGQAVEGFDWRVDFAEVFSRKEAPGFDVVLANPPYVRQELIKELKPDLKRLYPTVYKGTADLYCYFYARAIQLLCPGGTLAFISSNKWFRAAYGANLRQHIAETCRVFSIADFGELPVFQTAATFPMIFIAGKGTGEVTTRFTQVKSLEAPYPDVLALIRESGHALPPDAIHGAEWTLTDAATAARLRQMERAGMPLGEYVKGQIYYGVKTGFNTAFVIDGAKRAELIARDPRSAEIIKPLAVGDDVRKWHIREKDKWLIVTPIGIKIKKYPAVFAHLQQWQTQLEKRWDKGNHWWELRACDYYHIFDEPKIVYPEIAKEPRFTLDTTRTYPLKTVFTIPSLDLFLLGILNSAPAWDYLKGICSVLGDAEQRGRLTLQGIYVSQLPIPGASDSERNAIAALVQKCLDAKGINCEAWEQEIDERVAALYGL